MLRGRLLFIIILLALPAAYNSARAQLCQGSLGDPLVNITFGSGPNPGPPLAAAATGYQFVTTDCPNDGFYTVRSNTDICFGNSWHHLSSDHTGNPNGYFMLVNASYQPGAFYIDTVKGLCTGSTYEFAAWVINVLKNSSCGPNAIMPNLTFTIERTDGTVLQTYSSGNIPVQPNPAWQQYGFFFTTPAGVSDVVVRIVNNSPGGCGNDLALDDITFRPCGPQISVSIAGLNGTSVKLCEGQPASFTLEGIVSPGFNNPSFQWQQMVNGDAWTDIPGQTGLSFSQNFLTSTAPGVYSFRLSAAEAGNMSAAKCRVMSGVITVTIAANPVTNASGNSPLCEGKTISMSAGGGADYQWTGVNNFTASGDQINIDNALAGHSGRYYVTVTNAAGCTSLDSVDVQVNGNPVASVLFTNATICEGDNLQLQSQGGGSYKWTPSTGLSSAAIANPFASPPDTTNYTLVVTNQFNCTDTAYVTLNVAEKARANAGPDQYIMKGKSVELAGTATGQNIIYSWAPAAYIDNPLSLQAVVKPPHDTSYLLTVVSKEGCGVATDAMRIYVYPDIYVPNAFSPNNDGINDTWFIPSLRAWPAYKLSVYNRHGQLLFQTKNMFKPWDGKYHGEPQPIGVYVYVLDLGEGGLLKGTLMIVK